jgi:hypothetical protein
MGCGIFGRLEIGDLIMVLKNSELSKAEYGEGINGEKKVVLTWLSMVEKPSSKTVVNLFTEESRFEPRAESNSKETKGF